jgi:hypothetical protein
VTINSYRDLDVWQKAMDLVESLLNRSAEIGRMLNGLRKSLQKKPPAGPPIPAP